MIEVKEYERLADEGRLFQLICNQGEDWSDYWCESGWARYKNPLTQSVTYVAYAGDALCGYIRCRDDDGFGVYIYDLLVDKAHRGHKVGALLAEAVCKAYPGKPVYVMSDVDIYYEKQGYEKIGSIFSIQ